MQFYLVAFIIISDQIFAQKFPDGFLFGVTSSSYQIEGAWNADGKGEHIWDTFTHRVPSPIVDSSNGDVSADSYHHLEQDVILLKHLKVDFYVFSLSWSRILPKGLTHQISVEGVRYYHILIDTLLKHDITPMIVLFHWDTPQPIEDLGGFANPLVVDWFEEYAKVVFENYGNRIKYWITFNEPKDMCLKGYGSDRAAPGYNASGLADYKCAHNILRAHAQVYHLYNSIYKPLYKGKLSIGLGTNWYEAASNSTEDIRAAQRALEFSLGWFADPIYHSLGLYPKVMYQEIEATSTLEGFPNSRLPKLHKDDAKYIQGTYDFFALNYFRTEVVAYSNEEMFGTPSYYKDRRVKSHKVSEFSSRNPNSFKASALGLQKLLNYVKDKYQNPEIIITGNGYEDNGGIEDKNRILYLEAHLLSVQRAIEVDNVNVLGYSVWSFLDGFEWEYGYMVKFGLHHVDFQSPHRTRTPKASAKYYGDVITNKAIMPTNKNSSSHFTHFSVLGIILLIICVGSF